MADYRMPLSHLPGHVLAKILCDVAESETETGLVELLEARGYGTLLLFRNSSPHLLNWLAYVNTRTWVRLVAETTVVPVARDVQEMRYTSRVHDLCDLVRLGGRIAATARELLQRLRDSGAYAQGSPQATLLDDGIAGNPQRYPPVPRAAGPRDPRFSVIVMRSAYQHNGGPYGPVDVWDTRNVTNMSGAFFLARGMHLPGGILSIQPRALDLAFWDTRRVTDMRHMFLSMATTCTGLRNWNTSSVLDMSHMFFDCEWTPDVGDWVTSRVRDASSMFASKSLVGRDEPAGHERDAARGTCNPDVSRWDTRALENAEKMFMNLVQFNRDLSRWDTRRLRRAPRMFLNARSFYSDLSKWDMASVRSATDVAGMFEGCPIAESCKPHVTERGREDEGDPEPRFVDGKLRFV